MLAPYPQARPLESYVCQSLGRRLWLCCALLRLPHAGAHRDPSEFLSCRRPMMPVQNEQAVWKFSHTYGGQSGLAHVFPDNSVGHAGLLGAQSGERHRARSRSRYRLVSAEKHPSGGIYLKWAAHSFRLLTASCCISRNSTIHMARARSDRLPPHRLVPGSIPTSMVCPAARTDAA